MNKNTILFPKEHIRHKEKYESFLFRRIELNDQVGIVKYIGKLKHKDDPDTWVGIEWDDHSRGKHDGFVEGIKYFDTRDNIKSGSLIKLTKINFGISFEEALKFKYINKTTENDLYIQANNKRIDIEFVGKDKADQRFSKLDYIERIDLSYSYISSIDSIPNILPRLKEVVLQKTLFHKWSQFLRLFEGNIESINFTDNLLSFDEDYEMNIKFDHKVKNLVLNKCRINFCSLYKLSPLFKSLENLYLYNNEINDFDISKNELEKEQFDILKDNLSNIKFISLEKNNIKCFSLIINALFNNKNSLKAINFNQNNINYLIDNTTETMITIFQNLNSLYIDYNAISDEKILKEVSLFQNLTDLDILNNQFALKSNIDKVKCELIGRLKDLKIINNTVIPKDERKDYEKLYLKTIVQEYVKNNPNLVMDEFLGYMKDNHPNYYVLRKKYFDPLEDYIENKSIQNTNTIKGNIVEVTFVSNDKKLKKRFPKNTSFYNLRNLMSKLFKLETNFSFYLNQENEETCVSDESKTLDYYSYNENNIIYLK